MDGNVNINILIHNTIRWLLLILFLFAIFVWLHEQNMEIKSLQAVVEHELRKRQPLVRVTGNEPYIIATDDEVWVIEEEEDKQ
jgi:hypothetical protein